VPTQLCAAGMAFMAFSVSMFVGLFVGNDFITVVSRAIVALFVFLILGMVVSMIGQKIVLENFKAEAKALDKELRDKAVDEYQKKHNITHDSEDVESLEGQEDTILDESSQVANV
jgi:uncharacterized membrane protein